MASTSLSVNQAFVLRTAMVARICDVLERNVGVVEIKARCGDGVVALTRRCTRRPQRCRFAAAGKHTR